MKKLLVLCVIFFIHNQISFSQFSNEEVDQIINDRVWCVTNIIIDGESKGPDGKWIFISGMNLVSGEDDKIGEAKDILSKKYTENGIVITFLDRGESLAKVNLTINKNKTHPDSNEYSYKPYTYVELKGSSKNDNGNIELILSCTSLIHGESRTSKLPSNNWDGNK